MLLSNIEGGLVHYTAQLANELAKNNDVLVLAPKNLNLEYFNLDVRIKEVDKCLGGRLVKRNLISVKQIIDLVKKFEPDIIHIMSDHISIAFSLLFLKKYIKIVTLHNPEPLSPSKKVDWIPFILDIIASKIYIRFSDRIIVHGKNLKQILVNKNVNRNKIEILPHGDYSFFTKWKSEKITEEKNTMLFFGFIAPHKGIKYLIRAAEYVLKDYPELKVIIAGKGDFDRYKKYIKHRNNFEIYNRHISNKEVAILFQRASIIILPYIKASQSGIIPIAYAFSKPVIVTNVGSLKEIVDHGKTGFIVKRKNSYELSKYILRILRDDSLKKKMGQNAFKKMTQELSWNEIATKTINIYKEALVNRLE